jgi:hypothetical protein
VRYAHRVGHPVVELAADPAPLGALGTGADLQGVEPLALLLCLLLFRRAPRSRRRKTRPRPRRGAYTTCQPMLLLTGCLADVLLLPTIPEKTTPARRAPLYILQCHGRDRDRVARLP